MAWFRKNFVPRTKDNIEIYKDVLVPGVGETPSFLMGIGQGPGWTEVTSVPPTTFHPSAPAGGEFTVYCEQSGLPRDRWYLTNACKFFLSDAFGSDRAPTKSELWKHWEILESEIEVVEPKVIACLGAVATKWMMERAGLQYRDAECHRGMPVGWYEGKHGRSLLFSLTHPAAGIHATDSMRHILADFQALAITVKMLERGEEIPLPVDNLRGSEDFRRIHTRAELEAVLPPVADPDLIWIAKDTEGSTIDPIMLQFSFIEGTGYAIYAEDAELIAVFAAWLAEFIKRGGRIFMHNALYDVRMFKRMNVILPDGSWVDTMVIAFLLGTEPLGLKPLAHRIAGMNMQSYEEQVGPKSEEIALNYLLDAGTHEWPPAEEKLVRDGGKFKLYKPQSIGTRIEKILKDWSEQDRKVEHVTHVEFDEQVIEHVTHVEMEVVRKGAVVVKRRTHKYYVSCHGCCPPGCKESTKHQRHTHDWYEQRHDGACPPGCKEVDVEREKPVDIRDRWFKADRDLRAPVEAKLGRMREATLRDIDEKKALAYSCNDPSATLRVGKPLLRRAKEMGLERALAIDMGIQPMIASMMDHGIYADREHFVKFGQQCQDRMDQIQYEIYNLTGRDINLASGPQLSALLFDELRLPSDRWTDSRDRLSTDKKALEPLRFMHPVVPLVLEHGELDTLKNNFAEVLPERLDADSRIHCQIGMTRVPSGRLNTRNPNLMAIPTRTALGRQIREGFYAPKGHKIVCCDLCLAEGTQVDTPYGPTPIEELKPGAVVFSYRGDRPCATKVQAIKYTGIKECLRVTLDNGKSFIASRDHKIATIVPGTRGEWEKVSCASLMPGARLLSLKRQIRDKRTRLYGFSSFQYVMEHKAVAEAVLGPTPEGYEVHHVDLNPCNNKPENLTHLQQTTHRKFHGPIHWAKQDHTLRLKELRWSLQHKRRSYNGEGNPNFGKFQCSPRNCDHCGKEYQRPPTQLGRFCSKRCATIVSNRNRPRTRPGVIRQCFYCKQEMYCSPSRARDGGKYCSMDCRVAAGRFGLNCKVVSIEPVGDVRTWDIQVEESSHVFALSVGPFVSNSQIELKVEAHESQDPVLMNVFLTGIDGHTDTAQRLFGTQKPTDLQRSAGKTINFLIVNRGGGQAFLEQLLLQKLAAPPWQPNTTYIEGAIVQNVPDNPLKGCHRFTALTAGVSSRYQPRPWDLTSNAPTQDNNILWMEIGPGWTKEMCDTYVLKWYDDHPGVRTWHESLFAEARRFGFVRDWAGRLRYSPEIKSSIPRIREAGMKQIANHPIQSGAQCIMKIGMALVWQEMVRGLMSRMKVHPLIQVHDDLVCLVEDSAVDDYMAIVLDVMKNKVAQEMEQRYGCIFTVPLGSECKVGETWGSVAKVKKEKKAA